MAKTKNQWLEYEALFPFIKPKNSKKKSNFSKKTSVVTTVDPQERSTWSSGVRSAMHAASKLPGWGLTDVDDAPAPAL